MLELRRTHATLKRTMRQDEAEPVQKAAASKRLGALLGFLALAYGAAAAGAFVGPQPGAPGDWYANLVRPDGTPPGWVFGPVWTVLYAAMGVAAWLALRAGDAGGEDARRRARVALGFWFAQWIFNAAWSPLFFGAHCIGWALVDIAALWLAVGACTVTLLRVTRGGWLFVPYWIWVSFASYLNWGFWTLNPQP